MSELTEAERGYLAGILDGEGHVTLAGRDQRKYFTPYVEVSNTRSELIQWLGGKFGGHVNIKTQPKKPQYKPCFYWSIAGQKALHVLRMARPYLLLKHEQADILLSLKRYYVADRDSLGRIKRRMTQEDFDENARLKSRIAILNRRGVPLEQQVKIGVG